jgi:hypothetical protein
VTVEPQWQKNSTLSVKNKPALSNLSLNAAESAVALVINYPGIDGSLSAVHSMFLFIMARNMICNE